MGMPYISFRHPKNMGNDWLLYGLEIMARNLGQRWSKCSKVKPPKGRFFSTPKAKKRRQAQIRANGPQSPWLKKKVGRKLGLESLRCSLYNFT